MYLETIKVLEFRRVYYASGPKPQPAQQFLSLSFLARSPQPDYFLSQPATAHHRWPSNCPSGHCHWEHAAVHPTAAPPVQHVHAAVCLAAVPTLCHAQEAASTPWPKAPPPSRTRLPPRVRSGEPKENFPNRRPNPIQGESISNGLK
jgi:hypothetical protein